MYHERCLPWRLWLLALGCCCVFASPICSAPAPEVTQGYIRQLSDANATVRADAAVALGELKDPLAVEALIGALNDTDHRVGYSAATALGEIGDERALTPLLRQAMSADERIRLAAAKAVGQLGEVGIAPLCGLLTDRDAQLREAAAWGLGEAKGTNAVAPLLAALKDDAAPVRRAALQSLLRIRSTLPKAPECQGILKAVAALITDTDVSVRRDVVQGLSNAHDAGTVAALLQALGDTDDQVRWPALSALVPCIDDPRVTEAIKLLLKDKDAAVRARAFAALPQQLNIGWVELCDDTARHDPDAQVRMAALEVVRLYDGRQGIDPALKLLQNPDAKVRRQAANNLMSVNDPRVLLPLLTAWHDADADVRSAAFGSLMAITRGGTLHDPVIITPLLTSLTSKESEERTYAAYILGYLGNKQAVGPLLACLKDESAQVRTAALDALTRMTPDDPAPLLAALRPFLAAPDAQTRLNAAITLAQLAQDDGFAQLVVALRGTDSWIRQQARDTFIRLKDPRAPGLLLPLLQEKDEDLRRQVVWILGAGGNAHVIEPLLALLPDKSMRGYPIEALGHFDDPRVEAGLLPLLAERDYQGLVLSALRQLRNVQAIDPVLLALLQTEHALAIGEQSLPSTPRQDIRTTYNSTIAEKAIVLLSSLGAPLVPQLIAKLSDGRPQIRQASALALSHIPDARAVPALLPLLHETDIAIRRSAIGALGAIRDTRAVDPLLGLLRDEDAGVRNAAATALVACGDLRGVPLCFAETTKPEQEQQQGDALHQLLTIDDPRVLEPLCAALRDRPPLRYLALTVLAHWRDKIANSPAMPRVAAALLACMQDDNVDIRVQAHWVLCTFKDERVTALLLEALQDQHAEVRNEAANMLGAWKVTRAADTLLALLKNDADERVRSAAAYALAKLADPRAIELYLNALHSVDENFRFSALISLKKLKEVDPALPELDRAVEPLLTVLQHADDLQLAGLAAKTLIAFKQPRASEAIPDLITALRQCGSQARPAIAEALKTLTGQNFGMDVERWEKWQQSEDARRQRL